MPPLFPYFVPAALALVVVLGSSACGGSTSTPTGAAGGQSQSAAPAAAASPTAATPPVAATPATSAPAPATATVAPPAATPTAVPATATTVAAAPTSAPPAATSTTAPPAPAPPTPATAAAPPPPAPSGGTSAASSGNITLRIVSPRPGQVIAGGEVQVEYQVTGIRTVSPGGRNRPGEGHVHVYLNNEEKRGPWNVFTFSDLPPGSHTVTVEVQENDHAPLNPPLEQSVTFTVQ